jgi:hypothetical protein
MLKHDIKLWSFQMLMITKSYVYHDDYDIK